ncbi:hypothetical protein RJ640_027760 [Escallonia rubra]|uniref:Transposase (putative) gypsy type domain-containing protein n=1 Tax=Escallonia rubra TaxID=112253 RepID=A0AA88UJ54_9ASTE|nr:hypothetical protein RJ640_027760 [Escallonia rubra]
MTKEELTALIQEYSLPDGWYARVPGLQEPANHGTIFETGIYDEQVKYGYRLPLHPFALSFFKHYRMAPRQLVLNGWRKLIGLIYLVDTSGCKPDPIDFMRVFFEICFIKGVANPLDDKGDLPFDRDWNPYCKDFENPGKPTPNNLTKHIISHIKLRGGLSIDEPLSEQQLEYRKIIPRKPIPAGLSVLPPPTAVLIASSTETAPLVSIDEDPIFRPRWTIRRDDMGTPNSQISEQHLRHGVLPRDKEVFQDQTHESFACSFAQAVYTMYASGTDMLSRFEMARDVATEEAQQKRYAIKEAEEATRRAEELSKREADYLAHIETLERRLERENKRLAKKVRKVGKARDQGIRDFLEKNARDEWLKKRTDDGLEIYEMGFAKAKEMFAEHFPDIHLDDFVMPAVVYPSRETAMPLEAGDTTVSHPPEEGPSGDAPEP